MSEQPGTEPQETTFFDRVGGQPFFDRLVDVFYEGIATDPVLLPLYPDQHDLAPARRRLALFLGQYWGGPMTYSDERGHPRLRMRHNPYVIDDEARDAWLRSMRRALDRTIVEQGLDPAWEQELWRYLVGAAIAMVNQMPPEQPGIPVQDAQEPPR